MRSEGDARRQVRKLVADAPALRARLAELPGAEGAAVEAVIARYRESKRTLKAARKDIRATSRDPADAERARLDALIKATEQALSDHEAALVTALLPAPVAAGAAESHAIESAPKGPGIQTSRHPDGPRYTQWAIRRARPADEAAWQEFVTEHPAAMHAHDHRWPGLLADVFAQHDESLVAVAGDDERIVGILPMIRIESMLFGRRWVSLPWLTYGGALGSNARIEVDLMEHAAARARTSGAKEFQFRDRFAHEAWNARTDKVSMWLDLPEDADALMASFPAKLRSQIRKGLANAVELRVGGTELLSDFHAVYARNMRDLGSPANPPRLFKQILESFPESAELVVQYIDGRLASGGLLLFKDSMVEIPWASTVRTFNRQGANMSFYWQVLAHCIERGARIFDFGRSSRASGTWRFKAQWGAQEQQLYWHGDDTVDAEQQLTTANPSFSMAIRAWRHLPLPIANALGPRLVRGIP